MAARTGYLKMLLGSMAIGGWACEAAASEPPHLYAVVGFQVKNTKSAGPNKPTNQMIKPPMNFEDKFIFVPSSPLLLLLSEKVFLHPNRNPTDDIIPTVASNHHIDPMSEEIPLHPR
ncbi:hypothetical protein NE237_016735 [Protea cynaroides]|uniref:Uncharacterized protein n=1 Tax=Protea cynaroides TaxID=273540 RepID=A0A9Q0HGL2_9MAGN|nr:hypothetical protein NE237_016735 [Protea cynaroides]